MLFHGLDIELEIIIAGNPQIDSDTCCRTKSHSWPSFRNVNLTNFKELGLMSFSYTMKSLIELHSGPCGPFSPENS